MADSDVSFDRWYREVHLELSASLMVAFGDADLASDAADEAIARAYERWDRVSLMRSPGGWTYRVAVNVARRKRRRRVMEGLLLQRQRNEQLVEGPAGELWFLVRQLPERQRLAIAFRHVSELTEEQIGHAMGVTRGTVSATLRQAYRSLKNQLDDDQVIIEETKL